MSAEEGLTRFSSRSCITASLKSSVTKEDIENLFNVGLPATTEGEEVLDEEVEKSASHDRNVGEWTVIAFINSASGGGKGTKIAKNLKGLLGEKSVFDLKACKAGNMPEDILVDYAFDPKVRVLVCGGDGTMGWILSSIDKMWKKVLGAKSGEKYKGHLPIAIMPLGTGNDLSRMFKWGPLFQKHMKKKPMITNIRNAPQTVLDRWRCVVLPIEQIDEESRQWIPAVLAGKAYGEMEDKSVGGFHDIFSMESFRSSAQVKTETETEGEPQDKNKFDAKSKWKKALTAVVTTNRFAKKTSEIFDGVFCNYVSFGFDAQVAFEFHKERELHRERFTSPTKNKLIYLQKALDSGGLMKFRESKKPPPLKNLIRIVAHNAKTDQMENIDIPDKCRGLAILNIQSYAAGNKIVRGGSYNDGLLEVVLIQNVHRFTRAVAFPFSKLPITIQTNRLIVYVTQPVHCQVDGEPWLQSSGIFQISRYNQSAILRNDKASVMNCTACTP